MNRKVWQTWRIWAFVALATLAGCDNLFGPQRLPKDPLFLHHPPVEGRPTSSSPATLVVVEPAPPRVPLVIASRPNYGRRESPAEPDRVVLTGQREVDKSSRPAPAIHTHRPFPSELILSVPSERRESVR